MRNSRIFTTEALRHGGSKRVWPSAFRLENVILGPIQAEGPSQGAEDGLLVRWHAHDIDGLGGWTAQLQRDQGAIAIVGKIDGQQFVIFPFVYTPGTGIEHEALQAIALHHGAAHFSVWLIQYLFHLQR